MKNTRCSLAPGRAPLFLAAALSLLGSALGAQATLKVGLATEPASLDPQFSTTGATQQASQQLFDTIIGRDKNLQPEPSLALSWTQVDPLTWEIKLRPGVKFHDGKDFGSADVVYSVNRIPRLPESPSSYKRNVAAIKDCVAVDPLTVRFTLKSPSPQFPLDLSFIYVLPRDTPSDATVEDFNKGKYVVGTGPFKFVEWVRGDRLVLERNRGYWGRKPAFDKVIFRPITNDPSRVAALLAGDVDIIDQVSPVDQERLRKDARISVLSVPAATMMYIHMDSNRDATPFVRAKDGSVLAKNPLKDPRVREALSLSINRAALVQRVLGGAAVPAGQFVPEGMVGWAPELKPDAYDPERAKKLLAEAGYPEGFSMTIHGPNDRYLNDEQVTQTIGQFFARIGIDIKVQALPYSVFSTAATNLEYSIFLMGFGNTTGDAARGMTAVLATFDKATGMGANNRGRYSNPAFDKLIQSAAAASDEKRREKDLQDAVRIAVGKDRGIIPLYFQTTTWAMRKGLTYVPRMDEMTLARDVAIVK
ncbi:MAG TPA: ABC transporter substrate-binding protein [Spirochaetales bacterium]|nr:ABC transporter substrate-binding protein [Spirochaetales bacterium]HRY55634.1 ABC transporter substrate-binding protein [Spirochaetia bacterium]HRZ64502.1 ABC transporter substrate-binding protein [Spirochaetia bacterium]